MTKPLSITSTTNFHALGNYATLTLLGLSFTLTDRAQALDVILTPRLSGILMTLMVGLGSAAFVICLRAAQRKDPTSLLKAETIVLTLLTLVLITLLTAIVMRYGLMTAMTSSVLLFGILFGSIGRAIQASHEYRHLKRARREPLTTIEVAAEPDLE